MQPATPHSNKPSALHKLNNALRFAYQKVRALPGRQQALLVLGLYLLGALFMTWPLAYQFNTHIPGMTGDQWTHQWTFAWVRDMLLSGQSPFDTTRIFYPEGVSITSHNIAWFNIALWIPLQALIGHVPAYNTLFLATYVFNAWAMYVLARDIVKWQPAAFLAGCVYGFWPYIFSHNDHPNMVLTGWVPLIIYYLNRTLSRPNWRDTALATLFLVCLGITRWQLLVMGGFLIGTVLLYRLISDRQTWTWRHLGHIVAIGGGALLIMLPLAAPLLLTHIGQDTMSELLTNEHRIAQTDPLAYLMPSPYHPLWGRIVPHTETFQSFFINRQYTPYLGTVALAVVLYGTFKALWRWRTRHPTPWPRTPLPHAFWFIPFAVYILLAIGPLLRLHGNFYPSIPLPYRLIEETFFIQLVRRPDRFNIILGIPWAMLVAFGVRALRDARPYLAPLLTVTLAALLLFDYTPIPYVTANTTDVPTWYQQLPEREPETFAVLDLPINRYYNNKLYMFYQLTHGKPLVFGRIARVPPDALTFAQQKPILASLNEDNRMPSQRTDVSHQLDLLAEANIRYIVLHKSLATPEQMASWREWLLIPPTHEDEQLAVYATRPDLHPYTANTQPIGETNLHATLLTNIPTPLPQGHTLETDILWVASAAPPTAYNACLIVQNEMGTAVAQQCTPITPKWPTHNWEKDDFASTTLSLPLSSDLPAGPYTIGVALEERETAKRSPVMPLHTADLLAQKPSTVATNMPPPNTKIHRGKATLISNTRIP